GRCPGRRGEPSESSAAGRWWARLRKIRTTAAHDCRWPPCSPPPPPALPPGQSSSPRVLVAPRQASVSPLWAGDQITAHPARLPTAGFVWTAGAEQYADAWLPCRYFLPQPPQEMI